MAYAQTTPIAGQPQQGYLNSIDTIQKAQLGQIIVGVDSYFGAAEFQYVQFPASTAFTQGQGIYVSGFGGANGYVASVAPTTANTGRPIAVVFNAVASVAAVQYGWVIIGGNAVLKVSASVAAGSPIGLDTTTAGSFAANSAGRQVLNAVSLAPSTTTVVKVGTVTNGSTLVRFQNVDGIVPGLTVSGTGVSGTVTAIDPDNRTVTLSAAATAGGNTSVTFTYTGFIVAQINRPFVQGAIT